MSDPPPLTFRTTPVKQTRPPPNSRKEMTVMHLPIGSLKPQSTFCRTWLNVQDALKVALHDAKLRELAQDIENTKETCYKKIVLLLNHGSSLVHATFCPTQERIAFHDNHTYSPTNHPNDIEAGKPDIIGLRLSILNKLLRDIRNRIPWHHVLSTVEEKTDSDADFGPGQSAAYLGYANQARPDLVGMYGLAVSPRGFHIQYSSPAGLATSEEFDWTQLAALLSYTYTLYFPRPGLSSRDPSITLAHSDNTLHSPTWNIRVGQTVYEKCQVECVGDPWRRMTWVVKVGGVNSDKPIVIKDYYCDVTSRSKEGEIYKILHSSGPAPGFARIDGEYELTENDIPIKVTMGKCTRVKVRLVMRTWGLSIYKTPTLVDFLKSMYDILEAHRWAVARRGILHRDISHGNIIIGAKDYVDEEQDNNFEDENPPVFVNEVLTGIPSDPTARLLDFDNGTRLSCPNAGSEVVKESGPMRQRTGTPKFIARVVGSGILVNDTFFRPMPIVPDDIAERYKKAHSNDPSQLRSFADTKGSRHGGYLDDDMVIAYGADRPSFPFIHEPRHDAESVFWCIAVFLLRAKPASVPHTEDKNNPKLREMWTSIGQHVVTPGRTDSRADLMDVGSWKAWLHEKLDFAANLMQDLVYQVKPEWGFLTPQPHPLHLHEAMQRILLKYIHLWESRTMNIELDTEEIRAVHVPIPTEVKQRVSYKPPIRGQIISVSTLGKRSSYSITEPEEPEAKRRHMFSILPPNLSEHLPSPLSDEGNTTSSDELEEEEEVDWIEVEEAWIDLNATPTPLNFDSEGEETSA